MLITVVTVCYNVEETIRETMQSVLHQTYSNIEYIIVDGLSTDGTLSIIKQNITDNIVLISEKDNGIYDAMNKAIKIAKGEYIIFINSGDSFYDNHVVEKFVKNLNRDVVYGDVILKDGNNKRLKRFLNGRIYLFFYLLAGMMINHQTIFARTELLKEYPFDLKYKICADRDFLCNMLKQKRTIKHVKETVSIYDNTGVSSQEKNMDIIRNETDMMIKKYYKGWYYLTIWVKFILRKMRNVLVIRE